MNIEEIYKANISINIDKTDDKIIEPFRCIFIKIIKVIESTVYKICENKNIINNLINSQCNILIFNYLNILFEILNNNYEFDNNICNNIEKLKNITNEDEKKIINKIYYIVKQYYDNLDRSEIEIDDYEIFIKNIDDISNSYFNYNLKEIYNIIIDKEFNL